MLGIRLFPGHATTNKDKEKRELHHHNQNNTMATTATTDSEADPQSPQPHVPVPPPPSSSTSTSGGGGGGGGGGPPKKYLCNAPRPNDYETKKGALLKSFGGDMTKLRKVARSTIRKIRRDNPLEKRSGPGRKSNAEHAMGFYSYLLDNIDIDDVQDLDDDDEEEDEENDGSGEEDVDSTGSDNEKTVGIDESQDTSKQEEGSNAEGNKRAKSITAAVRTTSPATARSSTGGEKEIATTNPKKSSATQRSNTTSEMKSSPSSSSDAGPQNPKQSPSSSAKEEDDDDMKMLAEIPDEKRRKKLLSELADAWGDIPASGVDGRRSRRKATHFDPHSETPDSMWRSDNPYTGSSTGHNKKSSIQQSDRRETATDDDDDDKGKGVNNDGSRSAKATTDGSSESRTAISTSSRSPKNSERNKLEETDGASKSTSQHPKPGGSGVSLSTDAKPPVAGTEKINRILKNRKRPDGGKVPFCNYCRDDPKIKICVFCACRVCFGKHSKTRILLCDGCDDEYHTFCVGLDGVPSSDKWFCPNCQKPTKSDVIGARKSIPPKKIREDGGIFTFGNSKVTGKRERKPAKPWSPDVEAAKQQLAKSPTKRNKEPEPSKPPAPVRGEKGRFVSPAPGTVVKRGPGRPPKNSVEVPPKRGRGRPPKNASIPTKTNKDTKRKRDESSVAVSSKKQARQSKDASSTNPTKRRGPGRPPKSQPRPTSDDGSTTSSQKNVGGETDPEAPSNSVSVTVSRTGRVVKRNKYHDEIEDGPQHLHSDRLQKTSKKSDESAMDEDSVSSSVVSQSQSAFPPPSSSSSSVAGVVDVDIAPPVRKRVKSEDLSTSLRINTDLIGTKATNDTMENDDDVSLSDELPIAPVRMKALVQPSTPVRTSLPPASLSSIPENSVLGGTNSTIIEIRGKKMTLPEINLRPLTPLNYGQVTGNAHSAIPQVPSGRYPDIEATSAEIKTDDPESDLRGKSVGLGPGLEQTPAGIASKDSSSRSASGKAARPLLVDDAALEAAIKALPDTGPKQPPPKPPPPPSGKPSSRRKPGARECIQMSRRFGPNVIPERQMRLLIDYVSRGKVEHLIRMRERLDEHSRYLEHQLAGLEVLVQQRGESSIVVPPAVPKQKVSSSSGSSSSIVGSAGSSSIGTTSSSNLAPDAVATGGGGGGGGGGPKTLSTTATAAAAAAAATIKGDPNKKVGATTTVPPGSADACK